MNTRLVLFVFALCLSIVTYGQHFAYDNNVRSLQVTRNNNPLLPPVLKLGKQSYLTISWDEMSHDYHHYTYRIEHCTREWQPSTDIFESDYLQGTNNNPVEDYETSFNTTQLYTHYSITFPNRNANVLLSGNYRLLVYDDGDTDSQPVLEARFMVVEDGMHLAMQVSSNTDIDFNEHHQQVSLQLNYGALNVIDPYNQIHAVVMQNRRTSKTIAGIKPNINKATGLEWTHRDDFIFAAGNEYHKFEILNVNQSGMNVDHMRWFEPYHHATLWINDVPHSYLSAQDNNGVFYPRTQDQESNSTQSEYVIVHFTLESPCLEQDVYVSGQWSNSEADPVCQMHYNDEYGYYEAAILLKQGYYEYQYITEDGSTLNTMGDFWQTENEYQTFIYYRETGGRYDRIVGYQCINTNF